MKSCKGLTLDLQNCLAQSDCFRVHNHSFKDCMRNRGPDLPQRCLDLSYQLYLCRKDMLDMRARFRGHRGY